MPAPTKPARPPVFADISDREEAALGLCYALARDRARQLRQAAGDTAQPTHPTRRLPRPNPSQEDRRAP